MILDRMARRVTNSARLTLDSPLGWDTGGSLYDGKTLGAMKLPAVNACIEIISDSVAKMPIYLTDNATRERQTNHPALRLLTGRPTEALTAFDYHKLMESRRIAHGNAYALILRDRWGAPSELLPIAPGYMQPFLDDNGRLWYIGTNPRTGEFRKFWPADVLHYKAFSVDGLEGVSYLRRGAETIEAALQAQKYEVGFYKNGAKLTGILYTDTDLTNKPDITLPDGTKISIKDAIRHEWEHMYTGADNAFRTAIVDFGMKYMPITASNRDAQFIENKAASIEDVARLFNIPLYKLGVGKQTYVQDQYNAVQERQAADLESGSALAGQRETDLTSFTTLFGSQDTAQQYLSELKTMANTTPFLYSDLTAMSKTLKTYGYAADEILPALTSIGDAGAANGMTAADMTYIATALGRMRSSNLTTREDLDILQDRGIDAVGALASAKGVSKGDAYSMISGGDIAGTEAVQIIQSYMEQMYAGAMEQQSKTFEGLSSTLEGWNQELQNAMGEGYNEGKKIGMSDQIDWLEGEAGQKMMELNEEMGRFKADAENLQQGIYQDVFNGMFTGEIPADMDAKIAAQVEDLHQRYMNAMATIESSASSDAEVFAARTDLGTLKGEAETLAYNTYIDSDAADAMTAANIALADGIAASAGGAYENAGYLLGQELTKGISSAINAYVPDTITVPVVYQSMSTSGGIAAVAAARTATGVSTGSHLTGATSPYRAIGENRVPRDNTLYLLHEGERVLTAREARAQDQGGTGGVNIYMGGNYTVRQDSDIAAIAEAVAARILAERRIVRT